jgi:hypothetical protein
MDSDSEMELMKRGGRKRRPRATQVQKVKQSQVVNVTVHAAKPRAKKAASDMVMLLPDRAKPRGLFKAGYTPAEPLRAAGPGFFFANAPAPSQASSYGNAPAAVRPISDHVFRASSDPSRNFNQNRADDVVQPVNPSGIVTGVNEIRALPSAFPAPRILPFEQVIANSMPFIGRPVGPPANRVDEVRAEPSETVRRMLPTRPLRIAEASSSSSDGMDFPAVPFPPLGPVSAAERRRATIETGRLLGSLMEAEQDLARTPGSEAEAAALYRENMRRGGRVSIF